MMWTIAFAAGLAALVAAGAAYSTWVAVPRHNARHAELVAWLRAHGIGDAAGFDAPWGDHMDLAEQIRAAEAAGFATTDLVIGVRPTWAAKLAADLAVPAGEIVTFAGIPVLPVATCGERVVHPAASDAGRRVVAAYGRFCGQLAQLSVESRRWLDDQAAALDADGYPTAALAAAATAR